MTDVVLVHDDGPRVGFGHRRRMETLARSLTSLGATPRVQPLSEVRVDAPVVMVDSYLARADDPTRFTGGRVAAVDDLLRNLAVDLLVDPCPGAQAAQHPAAVEVLAGADYALLGSDLSALTPRPIGDSCSHIVVTAGGTGRKIATELDEALGRELADSVDVTVLAPAADGRPATGVAAALADADLVVTAGGVTMLESLALGRPTVVFVLADNQRRQVDAAAAAGAVIVAPAEQLPTVVAELANDPLARKALASAAADLIDGRGADRIAARLVHGL